MASLKKDTKIRYGFVLLSVLFFISSFVSAVPTTTAATEIGNNNCTLHGTGATSPAWFYWGQYTGKLYFKTTNRTPSGGLLNATVSHSPLYGSTTYYFKACDSTGCGSELTFTTLAVTPMPTNTMGQRMQTFMESENFDVTKIPEVGFDPYSWALPTDPPGFAVMLITGLMLFVIFYGQFVRGRNVAVPALVGGIALPFVLYGNQGLNLGIPPEMAAIGQGIWYACLAGIIMVVFMKR